MPAIIIEAALAVAIIASASMAMSYSFSSSALPYRASMSTGNEMYDLYGALLRNSTYSSCLSSLDAACVTRMLQSFNSFYGTPYASLSYGGITFSSGNALSCSSYETFCLPFGNGPAAVMSCITLCD